MKSAPNAAPAKVARGDSSHDRILGAARRLFASRGYEAASTAAIARAAGTSESQLMKHFGSKEGLLEAIFEQGWEQINVAARRVAESPLSPARKLDALGNVLMRAMEGDADLRLLMLLEGRRIRKEAHMVVLTRGFREFIGILDRVLRGLRATGQLRRGVHLDGVRSALMGAFEGLMRDQLLGRRIGYPARYSTRQAQQVLNVMIAAFAAPGARRKS